MDAEKQYSYIYYTHEGKEYCFLFSDGAFGGLTNWKAFYTFQSNITEVQTLPRGAAEFPVTKFVWYLGQ